MIVLPRWFVLIYCGKLLRGNLMAKRYTVYTVDVSYKQEYRPKKVIGGDTPVYIRRVNADSRLEALDKCLDDIRKEFQKLNCKYLSVFVGETHNPSAFAGRLTPIQVDVETGNIRKANLR
jgi:hypothetical protein